VWGGAEGAFGLPVRQSRAGGGVACEGKGDPPGPGGGMCVRRSSPWAQFLRRINSVPATGLGRCTAPPLNPPLHRRDLIDLAATCRANDVGQPPAACTDVSRVCTDASFVLAFVLTICGTQAPAQNSLTIAHVQFGTGGRTVFAPLIRCTLRAQFSRPCPWRFAGLILPCDFGRPTASDPAWLFHVSCSITRLSSGLSVQDP